LYAANYRRLGTIGRITVDGAASIWCDLRQLSPVEGRQVRAGGMKVDVEGRLIVADAGGGRLLRVAATGQQVEVLADRFEGSRFISVSDVALDLKGNIYFTDAGALVSETADKLAGAIYRYDIQTKKIARLASGLACPNGLAVSPDQMYLCVAESQRFRILLFDANTNAGTLLNQRVLIAFPYETRGNVVTGQFVPDGMVFDAQGRLYVAMWYGGVINVIDVPSGKLVRQYDAGGSQATGCHFSGAYLYVTVAAKEAVFRLKIDVPGHEYVTRTQPPSP
jgi:sugar lactone lactonase YvrE